MLRQVTLMVTLATIAVLVVAPAAQSKTIACKSGHVCKGTFESDWIFGSSGNDRILPMSGEDYVFGNGGNDDVAHSYDADMIFGSCGSDTLRAAAALTSSTLTCPLRCIRIPIVGRSQNHLSIQRRAPLSRLSRARTPIITRTM
jgi:Ca2+-binding RTX toxin-like protein